MSESKDNSKHTEGQIWLDILIKKNDPLGVLSENGLWERGQSNCTGFKIFLNKHIESKLPIETQSSMIFFADIWH